VSNSRFLRLKRCINHRVVQGVCVCVEGGRERGPVPEVAPNGRPINQHGVRERAPSPPEDGPDTWPFLPYLWKGINEGIRPLTFRPFVKGGPNPGALTSSPCDNFTPR
jgi:hypothetical protein